jgi:CheY-like chemotaxis protein
MLRFTQLLYPPNNLNVRSLSYSMCNRFVPSGDCDTSNMKIPIIRQQRSVLSCGTEPRNKEVSQKKVKIENDNPAKRQNIMIVDDEDDINLLFTMLLCGEGYNVEAFTDPAIAIMKFENGLYDLLIIDILLPKMDGFELYERLRQFDKEVKVCFLTAGEINYEQFKKAASFPEIITEDCFIKIPIENNVLIRKVKNILSIGPN